MNDRVLPSAPFTTPMPKVKPPKSSSPESPDSVRRWANSLYRMSMGGVASLFEKSGVMDSQMAESYVRMNCEGYERALQLHQPASRLSEEASVHGIDIDDPDFVALDDALNEHTLQLVDEHGPDIDGLDEGTVEVSASALREILRRIRS